MRIEEDVPFPMEGSMVLRGDVYRPIEEGHYPPLMEALGLPERYIPYETFVIGYPTETYLRIKTENEKNHLM